MSYFTADQSSQLIQPDPDKQFLFVNNDTVNPVYIAQSKGVNRESDQIPAQGSVSLTGWWYASSLDNTQTIECFVLPGGSQWSNPVGVQIALNTLGLAKDSSVNAPAYGPPTSTDVVTNGPGNITGGKKLSDVNNTLGTPAQSIDVVTTLPTNLGGGKKLSDLNTTLGAPAQDGTVNGLNTGVPNNIAVTGAPPIILSTGLINTGTQTINAGSNYLNPLKTFKQPGYEISLTVKSSAAAITPFVTVVMTWLDSVSGQTVCVDKWYLTGGNAQFQTYYGTGPTKGNQLSLEIFNGDAVNTCQISATMLVNSRTYVRDDWRQATFNGVPTYTNASYDPSGNVVFSTNPSVSGSSSVTRLLSLYAGNILVSYTIGANAGSFIINTTFQALGATLTSSVVYDSGTLAASSSGNVP